MNPRETVQAAVQRRTRDPSKNRALVDSLRAAPDLHTTCQRCGAVIRGTLEQLEAHQCQQDE